MKIKSLIHIFCKWLDENKERFLIKPQVASINTKQKNIKIIFPALPDILTADFYCKKKHINIYITAGKDGVEWDRIFDLDFHISKVENGYICDFCEGKEKIYPTLEAFAIQHIFEDFLNGCNENIGNAQGLALYGDADKEEFSFSWARLVPKDKKISDFEPDYYFPFDSAQSSSL